MSDSQGLDNLNDDSPTNDVSWSVMPMRVVGLDIKLGVIASLGGQGRFEPGQK
jgi:hypothetical protein